jgi:hypothetical protein
MSRVRATHDPTPNDATKASQTFHNPRTGQVSGRTARRQTTIVTSGANA